MVAYHWKHPLLAQSAWMIISLAGLLVLGLFRVESYFLVSFIGLLSVMLLFVPVGSRPKWWAGLRMVAFACFLVFLYILYRRVTMI